MNLLNQSPLNVKKRSFVEFLERSRPNYFDQTLMIELNVSKAHARMLQENNIISDKEFELVTIHIEKLREDVYQGKIAFPGTYRELFEMINGELFSPLQDVANKMQIGRSFTDQNVLTLKLLIRDEVRVVQETILGLCSSMVYISKKYFNAVVPAYNHMQQSAPNLLSNFFMSFYFMLKRDFQAMELVERECGVMPIGVDVGLEHVFSLDRTVLLKELGLNSISENHIDAISDRDYAISFQSSLATVMTHLSRMCEELILWSSAEFDYISVPQGYTLGTESAPWRKTADALEMVRGRATKVLGNQIALMYMYRTLPMGHQADYEDEREILFDSSNYVKRCLVFLSAYIMDMSFNIHKALNDVVNNYGLSFVVIEYLVKKSVTPREANQILTSIIAYCQQKNVGLESLITAEFSQFSDLFEEDIEGMMSVETMFNRDKGSGLGHITKKSMLDTIDKEEKIIKAFSLQLAKKKGNSDE